MVEIVSASNQRFKNAMLLHRSRGRKKQQRMIVFGRREIERAIASGVQPDEVFFCRQSELPNEFRRHALKLSPELFDRLAYGDRVGDLIMTAKRPQTELADLKRKMEASKRANLVVVVEQIEKPGNLGSILRSADGANAAAVIAANPITDVFHPNSIRNSCGAVFSVPIATGAREEVQRWLTDQKLPTYVATPEAERSYSQVNLAEPAAVVLGNEAEGVSQFWRGGDDLGFHLPMCGVADSLNVSVTAAVLMYEALRQQNQLKTDSR